MPILVRVRAEGPYLPVDRRQLPTSQRPGSWPEKAKIQTAVLVPKKGPVLARLGKPSTEALNPSQVSPAGGATQNSITKTPEDLPKGKEPQLSQGQCSPQNSQSQPDLSIPGWKQGLRHKPSGPNPQRSQALLKEKGHPSASGSPQVQGGGGHTRTSTDQVWEKGRPDPKVTVPGLQTTSPERRNRLLGLLST